MNYIITSRAERRNAAIVEVYTKIDDKASLLFNIGTKRVDYGKFRVGSDIYS